MHELILGGQRSGKSRTAESRAAAWLAPQNHTAVLLATAQAGDAEMRARIAQHRLDRAQRVPGLRTVEVPLDLATALQQHSAPTCLLVIDCLTLWLAQQSHPLHGEPASPEQLDRVVSDLVQALLRCAGPVVLVSNEVGLGVIPPDPATRAFVDAQGAMHRRVAEACSRVTLMVAGCEVHAKGSP